jgi:5-methyltetrahydrofolate--homocysteine methyltransferase
MTMPLLIGGATTSKAHTAIKIDPCYAAGSVVYVPDASRAVGVASALLDAEQRGQLMARVEREYDDVVKRRAAERAPSRRFTLEQARANRLRTDWDTYSPPQPTTLGVHTFEDYDLGELVPYIDWTPFFRTWELPGTYPRILDDPDVGETARSVFADAQEMLERLVEERWVSASAVVGIWPAASTGDDIVVFADEARDRELATLHTMRQQLARDAEHPNLALADFVAPLEAGVRDHIGAFAVTTGHRETERAQAFRDEHDDYSAILFTALCDRLAEAFAERTHERMRTELWAYAAEERLGKTDLIAERYQGIRPAPGYGCQPDHTEKQTIFALLDAPARTGITLTETCALRPGSSVTGLYLSHPQSRYFGVGRLGADQIEDYARRKDWTIDEATRALSTLGADSPAPVADAPRAVEVARSS